MNDELRGLIKLCCTSFYLIALPLRPAGSKMLDDKEKCANGVLYNKIKTRKTILFYGL